MCVDFVRMEGVREIVENIVEVDECTCIEELFLCMRGDGTVSILPIFVEGVVMVNEIKGRIVEVIHIVNDIVIETWVPNNVGGHDYMRQ
jgi:predicted ribosome-associated RNA-binding protein Tma20